MLINLGVFPRLEIFVSGWLVCSLLARGFILFRLLLPQVSSSTAHSLIWGDCHGHFPSAKMGTGFEINSMVSQRPQCSLIRVQGPQAMDCPLPPAPLAMDAGWGALYLHGILCPSGSQKHSEVVIWR